MDFDLTTFILEIVNFLVLLWLMHRFVFRPMQGLMAARSAARLAAEHDLQLRHEALQQQAEAQTRTQMQWAAQQDEARARLETDLANERQQALQQLQLELAAQRSQAQARWEHDCNQKQHQVQGEAKQAGMRFWSSYLLRLAGPELERAIQRLWVQDLLALDEAARQHIRAGLPALDTPGAGGQPTLSATAASAYPVDDEMRLACAAALTHALELAPQQTLHIAWRIDPTVQAGLRLDLPGHRLEASLRSGLDAYGGLSLAEGPLT